MRSVLAVCVPVAGGPGSLARVDRAPLSWSCRPPKVEGTPMALRGVLSCELTRRLPRNSPPDAARWSERLRSRIGAQNAARSERRVVQ